jgi:hypothetical protein
MEAAKQTGESRPVTVPFSPDEAWLEAFASQCTHKMRLKAKRYAARRARGVGKAGGHVDDYYVRELVEDALADTVIGVVAWDPAAATLEGHVLDVIKSRTRHDRVRAHRFRRASFDVPEGSYARAEIESSMPQGRETEHGEARFALEVLMQLQRLAHGDPHVLRLLDAIARLPGGNWSHAGYTDVLRNRGTDGTAGNAIAQAAITNSVEESVNSQVSRVPGDGVEPPTRGFSVRNQTAPPLKMRKR